MKEQNSNLTSVYVELGKSYSDLEKTSLKEMTRLKQQNFNLTTAYVELDNSYSNFKMTSLKEMASLKEQNSNLTSAYVEFGNFYSDLERRNLKEMTRLKEQNSNLTSHLNTCQSQRSQITTVTTTPTPPKPHDCDNGCKSYKNFSNEQICPKKIGVICRNGKPYNNFTCPEIIQGKEMSLENCNTCDKYYHLEAIPRQEKEKPIRYECVPNVCKCDNGTPVKKCLFHNNHFCKSCDGSMYELGEPEDWPIDSDYEELYDNISPIVMRTGRIIKIRKCEGAKIDLAGFF